MTDYKRASKATCLNCGENFRVKAMGRTPKFCRPACRTIHFTKNRRGVPVTPEDRQRLRTWELLKDAGIIPTDAPLPPKREPKPK